MIATATAVLGIALAGVDGTAIEVLVGGRAETSARVVREAAGTESVVHLDLLPRLDLSLAGRTLRTTFAWEPQLRASRELGDATSDTGMTHAGTARGEWDVSPGWRISGTLRGSERLVDVATASVGELARRLELGTAPPTVRYGEAEASAGVEGGLTRRLAVTSGVGVDVSGGRGDSGRAAIPELRRVRVAAGLVRDQTRRDVLRLDAAAVEATFDGGSTASLATVTGEWAHHATRELRLRLAGGASAARAETAPDRAFPEARAAVEWSPALLGGPVRAVAAVAAGAALDRWRTAPYERIGVTGDVSWAPTGRWTLRGLASWGRARDPVGATAGRGDLRVAWRSSPRLTVSGGLFGEWQRDPGLAAARSVSYWGSTFAVEIAPLGRYAP